MTHIDRRQLVQAIGAAATLGALGSRPAFGQGKGDIVIAAAQPLTGIFSFAGVAMHQGMGDYIAWKNANGGVAGSRLKYVAEDTGFKVDQGVAVVKKIMASEKPSFFYLDGTPLCKAVAKDMLDAGTVLTGSVSCAQVLVDPVNFPHHFLSSPTYGSMHEILMEYIARSGKASAAKPTVALVYSDSEFGRDGIAASKARAAKLGLQIVSEIVTKQAGVEVAPEVAKLRRAKPDVVVFQGYVVSPVPEFVKQMREAGMSSQIMGTMWGLDKPAYDALGNMGERLTGVLPYRYSHDTESKTMMTMREYVTKVRPQQQHISIFYVHAWLTGMIFSEVAERCIKAGKKLTMPNMKTALESMKQWDSGGLTGLLADLSSHQITSGRMYSFDPANKRMEAASGWIKV